MTQADPSPREIISEAEHYLEHNGRYIIGMTEGEYGRNVLRVADLARIALPALRLAEPYVIGSVDAETVAGAIRTLSAALGS